MSKPPLVVFPGTKTGRHYQHPETKELYPSVTTICDVLDKGRGMIQSAANNTAKAAYRFRETLQTLPEEKDAVALLKYQYKDAWGHSANLGSSVHEVCEALWNDDPLPDIEPDRAPYLDAFMQFVTDFDPEWVLVEVTVFSERYQYAGTFDFVMKIGEYLILGDHKTGKDIYPEIALQLAALRFADRAWARNTGELGPMPHVDATIGVHLQPGKYQVRLVNADHVAFQAFLGLRQAWPWTKSDQSGVGPAVNRERLIRAIDVTPQQLITGPLEVVKASSTDPAPAAGDSSRDKVRPLSVEDSLADDHGDGDGSRRSPHQPVTGSTVPAGDQR